MLTESQKRIFEFIIGYIEEHGYPPSIRDICRGSNLSRPSNATYYLNILADKGYIVRTPGVTRGIRVLKRA